MYHRISPTLFNSGVFSPKAPVTDKDARNAPKPLSSRGTTKSALPDIEELSSLSPTVTKVALKVKHLEKPKLYAL